MDMIDLRPQLFLVYNAEAGLFETVRHTVHRLVSPATYPCSLCALTHGIVTMRREWKEFLNTLNIDVVFYHRDDFAQAYPHLGKGGGEETALPAVLFAPVGREPKVMINAEELAAMADVSVLTQLIRKRLPLPQNRRSAAA